MRKEFAIHIQKLAEEDEKIIFLTGDLGFMALENIRDSINERFVNVGVSEQNMISMAASLAFEKLIPICYSIAPFVAFRPAEQIRIDVCLHNLNVKIVGNGGGFGYGIMGATHHAIEDIAVLSSFQNMRCFIPFCNEDVAQTIDAMFQYKGPSYLRLSHGLKPKNLTIPLFAPIRKLTQGEKITIISFGSITLSVLETLQQLGNNILDIFVVSEIPVLEITPELTESLLKTQKLIIIEEHVKRGGLGENIASLLLEKGIFCKYTHLHIKGYTTELYGNKDYHLETNQLSISALLSEINKMLKQ